MKKLTHYETIQEIAALRGKQREERLRDALKHDADNVLHTLFRNSLCKKLVYNIGTIDTTEPCSLDYGDELTKELIDEVVTKFTVEGLTGNAADAYLNALCVVLSKESFELLSNMLLKDMRCGVGATTFNKACYNKDFLVYQHPYNRLSPLNEKTGKRFKFPAFSQLKGDGKFADLIITKDSVVFVNRDGVPMNIIDWSVMGDDVLYNVNKYLETLIDTDAFVLSGELLVKDDAGAIMPRTDGNGLLSSSNTERLPIERLVFKVWAVRPYDNDELIGDNPPYSTVIQNLQAILHNHAFINAFPFVEMIETRVVDNAQEAIAHYEEMRELGEEGTCLKEWNAKFKSGTSTDQLKLKVITEGEVKVVGITEGKGKWTGCGVGALITESDDGKVVTNVAGITDAQRYNWWKNPELIVGKVISVYYNDVVSNKDTGVHSLFLPRFVEIRDDKSDADTLETLVDNLSKNTDTMLQYFETN